MRCLNEMVTKLSEPSQRSCLHENSTVRDTSQTQRDRDRETETQRQTESGNERHRTHRSDSDVVVRREGVEDGNREVDAVLGLGKLLLQDEVLCVCYLSVRVVCLGLSQNLRV